VLLMNNVERKTTVDKIGMGYDGKVETSKRCDNLNMGTNDNDC